MKTIEVFITGRVQKVGFRACIRRIATDLNVMGTVMNLSDGRVHIYASGEAMILEKFISMMYGCPRAVVRDVHIIEIPLKTFDDFSIIKSDGRINTVL
ncbi:acylphosphatase [uncultured Methanoregula sp.]|uniref:acylphosphatase n=1 Tax=uncultured Methanoregula sp. TaxID=1005933 RepID=UPI002AAAAAC2|nr:acylphosphatase [uncultured Methanoregula sp.]